MGFLDRFKDSASQDREPELKDREMILAYLEDLARSRTLLTIQVSDQDLVPYTGTVELLNDGRNELTLGLKRAIAQELTTKSALTLIFSLDGHRLQATARYVGRGGYMQVVVSLPDKVRFAERRGKLRAKFGSREKATVTALEDLFQGIGTTGKLVNLSLEGVCMQLERAISVQGDKKVEVHEGLFYRGQKLLLVRIQELPQIPTIECSGTVAYLRTDGGNVVMGLQLWGIGAQEAQHLEQVMTRRLPSFTREFPVRHRHHKEGADPKALRPVPPRDADAGEDEVVVEAAQLEQEQAAAPVDEEPKGRDRLIQWRRRSKHILLVMADDLDRAILAGTLQVGGFINLHEARSLVQALERCKKHLPDLFIIDGTVGPHTAPDIVAKLRGLQGLEGAPVVVLLDKGEVKVQLAAKAMRIKYLLPKPIDYDGVLKGLLDKLLDLQ